jgi:hypothetical protein
MGQGVGEMLRRRFPKLQIVRENSGVEPVEGDPTLAEALAAADFCLHGSGPSLVGSPELRMWREKTGKPYGVFGTTIEVVDDRLRDLLNGASFVFTRETASLKILEEAGVRGPKLGFVPDGTFVFDLRDDEAADRILADFKLERGRFLCAVPRLRYTPYWEIRPGTVPAARVEERKAINERYAEEDHAKLRGALAAWVRETGLPVLACPEMTYQVPLLGALLSDGLPEDVKPKVFSLGRYWRPDEAASLYERAFAVVSFECHSPILALAAGTPAVHLRQPTDTIKGQMYPDLGLGDWMLPIERTDTEAITSRLLAIHGDPANARRVVGEAIGRAGERFRDGVTAISRA